MENLFFERGSFSLRWLSIAMAWSSFRNPVRFIRFIPMVCFLIVHGVCHAEVVKWIDSSGAVHYGERHPIGKAITKVPMARGTVSIGEGLTPVSNIPAAAEQSGVPVATPKIGEVWIYVTPNCGYCRQAKEHMRLKGIPFMDKDITANQTYKAEFSSLGGRGVPVTLSGNQRINGYVKDRFETFLQAAGF